MPRKQNGFGNFKSSGVRKADSSFKTPGVIKSPGTYPAVRTYGTRITRTAVEKYNVDALYARWRRGYEYYSTNSFNDYDFGFPITFFTGSQSQVAFDVKVRRFASGTGKEDSAVHYTTKRIQRDGQNYEVATIDEVFDNALIEADAIDRNELWCSLDGYAGLLHKLGGEEVQSNVGSTEVIGATVRMMFDDQKRPNVFIGTTGANTSSIVYKVPLSDLNNPAQSLVGTVAVPRNAADFMPITSESNFVDDAFVWYFECNMSGMAMGSLTFLRPLPADEQGNPLDLLGVLVDRSTNATASMSNTFKVQKEPYQQWFGNRYISAQEIESYMEWMSIQTPPLFVMEAWDDGTDAYFKTVPIEMTMKLHGNLEGGYVAFSTNSFTKTTFKETTQSFNEKTLEIEETDIHKMIPDLDPYFLPGISFKSGDVLSLGPQYTCSCPSYSHAIVRSPERTYRDIDNSDKSYKKNRQSAYPMPTSGANKNPEGLSEQASGIINTWSTMSDIMKFSACKHTIASMFTDHIQVQEPNSYPAMRDRLLFEEKVTSEFANIAVPPQSVVRAELNQSVDFAWAISQQIQLSDTELGSILNGTARSRNDQLPVMGRIAVTGRAIDPITKVTIEES
jgi:hypothetical protein